MFWFLLRAAIVGWCTSDNSVLNIFGHIDSIVIFLLWIDLPWFVLCASTHMFLLCRCTWLCYKIKCLHCFCFFICMCFKCSGVRSSSPLLMTYFFAHMRIHRLSLLILSFVCHNCIFAPFLFVASCYSGRSSWYTIFTSEWV